MSNTGSAIASYHNEISNEQAIRELAALGINWPNK